MSKFQYHDSVTVETEVKKAEDLDSYNEENTDSLKSNRDKIDSTRDKSSQLFNNIEKFIKDINGKLIK